MTEYNEVLLTINTLISKYDIKITELMNPNEKIAYGLGLYTMGHGTKSAANLSGNIPANLQYYVKKFNITHYNNQAADSDTKAKLIKDYESGKSLTFLMKKYGYSVSTIKKYIEEKYPTQLISSSTVTTKTFIKNGKTFSRLYKDGKRIRKVTA